MLTSRPTRAVLLFLSVLLIAGCSQIAGFSAPPLSTEYQAVHLDNGQLLFGKLENAGGKFPVLRNVFSAQNRVNTDNKEVARTLVRRSVELHAPDYMVLSARHIVAIEPVAATSRVAQVIQQADAK